MPSFRWFLLAVSSFTATWSAVAESKPDELLSAETETVPMSAFVVRDKTLCSFGIGVQAVGDPKTKRISRLLITDVWEHSDAEKQGLKPGDEILSVNGIEVAALKGGLAPGGDLFELLINRPPGARIKLEVAVRVVKRLTIVAG